MMPGGFARSVMSLAMRRRSKYAPHQGGRECERRRIGGFHRLHAHGLQWSKRDIKRMKALGRAPLEINKIRPPHIGVDLGGPDQSVEAVFVKCRLAGLATRAREARTD